MQIIYPLQNHNKYNLNKVSYTCGGWALEKPEPPRRTPQVSPSEFGQTDGRTKRQLYAPPIPGRGAKQKCLYGHQPLSNTFVPQVKFIVGHQTSNQNVEHKCKTYYNVEQLQQFFNYKMA